MKKKRGAAPYINFISGSEHPQYVVKIRRGKTEQDVVRWKIIRISVGALACVALLVGVYLAVTGYIIPSTAAIAPAPSPEQSSVQSQLPSGGIAEAAEIIQYSTKTGLPIYEDADILFQVNAGHPLPQGYTQTLVDYKGIQVEKKILDALRAMMNKAEEGGTVLKLESGYITQEAQEALYNKKVSALITKEKYTKIMAKAKAEDFVAKPGRADTETGLCVTFSGLQDNFTQTAAYRWLNTNAVEFGFVFRYPEGKEKSTGLLADMRVLRYVGTDHAIKMRQLSMCLEEYMAYVG